MSLGPKNTHWPIIISLIFSSSIYARKGNRDCLNSLVGQIGKINQTSRLSKRAELEKLQKFNRDLHFVEQYHTKKTAHLRLPSRTKLSLENGREKLKTIRINFSKSSHLMKVIMRNLIKDYIEIMGQVGMDFNLLLTVASPSYLTAKKVLKQLNPSPHIRERISLIRNYTNETGRRTWAQDGSKPMVAKSGIKTYVQKAGNDTKGFYYRQVITDLAKQRLIQYKRSSFKFEGGNIIVGDDHIFMGPRIINHHAEENGISIQESLLAFEVEFGKPIIVVGTPDFKNKQLKQIDFHIDLRMAILSQPKIEKEVVILSSPKEMFKQYFGIEDINHLNHFEYKQGLRASLERLKQSELNKREFGFLKMLAYRNYESVLLEIEQVQYVRRLLERHGYEVQEIPGMNSMRLEHYESDIRNDGRILNSTNLIVSEDNIIVPGYDSKFYRRITREFFHKFGFKVHFANSSQYSFIYNGGIRCLSETYRHCK